MRQKLSLITLGVDNFERSVDFFEKLGWKKSPRSMGDLALFPLGGMTLALYPRQELARDVTVPYQPSAFCGITIAYNARSEAEVDEVIGQVGQLGATIVKQPGKVFWGGYSGYFRDLDGYYFEVAFNPFWEMDQNDNLIL